MPTPQVSPTAPQKAGLQDDKRRLFVTILLIFFVIVAWQYVSYLSVAKKFNAGASAHAEAPVHLTLSREQAQRLRARGDLAGDRSLAQA